MLLNLVYFGFLLHFISFVGHRGREGYRVERDRQRKTKTGRQRKMDRQTQGRERQTKEDEQAGKWTAGHRGRERQTEEDRQIDGQHLQ